MTRDTLIDYLQDGVVILNEEDRILDINRRAREIFNINTNELPIGDLIQKYLPVYSNFFGNETGKTKDLIKWEIEAGNQRSYYDLRLELLDYGKILTLHDTTETVVLINQVQLLASLDPLTEINNRREFYAQADEKLKIAIRYHRPLTLMLVDMDHFKEFNDRFGHQIGDDILITFAKYCQSNLRSTDLIGRYGGDEFIILLPETNLEQGARLAKK
nr:diguanylate cyclase [candidate division Zixibacteria bacterium]NIS44885.1 diguanylate cyclase [candidate division Zixibacteria bacterium]NIU12987.1 diguanylate cyclase [candidate division Zixibacteria bacterium]NIV05043.1 diguanylate cyclase [candidate division Zixibacteria bacterium]NIW43762.1 diguanylate cyclase [Gammaproteobacteria bacterium]